MWRQFLFWAMAGPKYFQRFALLWLILMGVFFYAFLNEATDRSPNLPQPPRSPAASTAQR